MRMNLLTGGEKVRQAESEAVDFYNRQARLVDDRIDSVATDLATLRSGYEVALGDALAAKDDAARAGATKKALDLRSEIATLEQEQERLRTRRTSLSKLASAVQGRGNEREKLVAQIETTGDIPDLAFGMPLGGVGL